MSTYQNSQNLINNMSNLKMDTRDDDTALSLPTDSSISPSNASPPDFDFNLPCRFFKSSFARSLSLTNASSNNSNNQCKSLDYEIRSTGSYSNNNNNKLSCLKRDVSTVTKTAVAAVPPLPQKRTSLQNISIYQQNEAINNNNNNEYKQVYADKTEEEKPPALPARRPLSLHNNNLTIMSQNLGIMDKQQNVEQNQQQQQQQKILTQLRQQAYKQATINNSNNNSIMLPVNGNNCNNTQQTPQIISKQKPQTQTLLNVINSNNNNNNNNNNNCNSSSVNNQNNMLRRNNNNNNNNNVHMVWPHQEKNVEQDCNICIYDQADEDQADADADDDFNSNYHDTTKSSTVSDFNNHFHNSHQMLHMIPAINIHNNHQQHEQQQQHNQMSSYEMLNDNTTNVEAVILQNQVDTLQWQLKQVETSCDMYRAVMEEVARFLERYQSQKQLQQQQQQQMATQIHSSGNNNKMEQQIPRSKSLFQVYAVGGHEKVSSNSNNTLDDTSTSLSSTSSSSKSYLRARSSTNLIDLKNQPSSSKHCSSKSKDDHNFETALTPAQSYSAFKDLTWRRSPKKTDSRSNTTKDDVEEKLNQEAFRLLRTIQNLLNTSQHQPDLAHQRHHLTTTAAALQMGRLSKAMSTTSVMTLPGPPMLNSTSLTIGANSAGCSTPDSSSTSPTTTSTISTANNAATNNLAPEMLFLRSANMRDSRLSLRSSTDSSVHSTSSAASSASSKVETDEDVSTPFHSPPNILAHKQQQQPHHLNGSSTEDESGFSSISSFPDIGVPLSSTMLSSTPSSNKGRLMAKELKTLQTNDRDLQTTDSRNSTLKANVVGLPLNSSQDMSHRWDSPSKTYHNASNKFQRFSALTNEDSNTVLWV